MSIGKPAQRSDFVRGRGMPVQLGAGRRSTHNANREKKAIFSQSASTSLFTLSSHPRSRVDSYTAGDLTGGNIVLYYTAHQKAELKSVVLAANGPDRRVGGIEAFWYQSAFWSERHTDGVTDGERI